MNNDIEQKIIYDRIKGKMFDNYFNYPDCKCKGSFDNINHLIDSGYVAVISLENSWFVFPARRVHLVGEDLPYSGLVGDVLCAFRRARNEFLEFMHKSVVVKKSAMLSRYPLNIVKQFEAYLVDTRCFNTYALNMLGCKAIDKSYNPSVIDVACLNIVKNILTKYGYSDINIESSKYITILEMLDCVKENIAVSKGSPGWRKYNRYIQYAKDIGLIEFIFSKSNRAAILTRKGFDLVIASSGGYEDYKDSLDGYSINGKYTASVKCSRVVDHLLCSRMISRCKIDSLCDKDKLFINELTQEISIFNKSYVIAKLSVYSKYHTVFNKEALVKDMVCLSKANKGIFNDHRISLDAMGKSNVLNVFNLRYKGKFKAPECFGESTVFIKDVRDVKSIAVLITLSEYSALGYVKFKKVGPSYFVMLTKVGCAFLNVKPYKDRESDILKKAICKSKSNAALQYIHEKGFVSKVYMNRLGGVRIKGTMGKYTNTMALDDKIYHTLNIRGLALINKPLDSSPSTERRAGIVSQKTYKPKVSDIFKGLVSYKLDGVSYSNIDAHIEFLQTGEYVVFDTEFTQDVNNYNNLIEIGAVKIKDGRIVDHMTTLISTYSDSLRLRVSQLTGITKSMLERHGVPERYAVRDFIKFIGDLPVLAHGVVNDWHLGILVACKKYGIQIPRNELIDSAPLFKSLFPGKKYGLDALIDRYGLSCSETARHRALGDSIYTFKAIEKALFDASTLMYAGVAEDKSSFACAG